MTTEICDVNCCKCKKHLGLIVLCDDKPIYLPNGVLHCGIHSRESIHKITIAANEDGDSDSVIFMYCDDCRKKEEENE